MHIGGTIENMDSGKRHSAAADYSSQNPDSTAVFSDADTETEAAPGLSVLLMVQRVAQSSICAWRLEGTTCRLNTAEFRNSLPTHLFHTLYVPEEVTSVMSCLTSASWNCHRGLLLAMWRRKPRRECTSAALFTCDPHEQMGEFRKKALATNWALQVMSQAPHADFNEQRVLEAIALKCAQNHIR